MATITSILATDLVSASRTTINNNFSNLNAGKAETASPTLTGNVTISSTLSVTGRADFSKVSTVITTEQIRINRATASSDTQSINFAGGVSFDYLIGRLANGDSLVFGYNGGGGFVEKNRLTVDGNFKAGGTASRGTTEGTNQIVIFDGTAPVGTLADGVSLYSVAGKLWAKDAAGNATQLTP